MVMKPCPDVSWDPRNTAVHKVIHKDVLLPAEKVRNAATCYLLPPFTEIGKQSLLTFLDQSKERI